MDYSKNIQVYFKELQFDEESHTYTYRDLTLNSVSSFIKRYCKPFNSELIAGFVAKKEKRTKKSVLEEWEDKKNKACDLGTKVHLFGEDYPFDRTLKPNDGFEEAIVNYWKSLPDHIVPVIMELRMFNETFKIAGTGDILLYNSLTDKYIVSDYKTNSDLFKNYKKQKLLEPFDHLLDCPYNKYQIQLSAYQFLFEQTGYKVESRDIVWLKPDGRFQVFQTDNLIPLIREELIKLK